jgi:hypothetical protein
VPCGTGRCCPTGYPVCCSNQDYCGTSPTACQGAGKLPPPPSSGSGNSSGSGSGSGSGGSNGGSSGGGGNCPCLATSAPSYNSCQNGDIAACYCAAAYLDSCGIQNAAAGCCTANQAGCIAQLKSDCQAQLSSAQALASPGVSPECSSSEYPACR